MTAPETKTTTLERWGDRAVQLYPHHRLAFISANVVVTIVNIAMGPPWWGVWVLLFTGALFTLHYLVFKARTLDDEWVEDRARDLYDRSYDQGHIDSIAGHHGLETPNDRLRPQHRNNVEPPPRD